MVKKYIISICVLILLSTVLEPAFAANSFVIIRHDQPIPHNTFIFVLVSRLNGETFMGYSKEKPSSIQDSSGKEASKGGIRNGGHVALLNHALGGVQSRQELEAKLPAVGNGEYIGGGFMLDSNGRVVIHEYYSHRAGGLLGSDIEHALFTINPRLPGYSRLRYGELYFGLIPKELLKTFYAAIIRRTKSQLVLAPTLGTYGAFIDTRNVELSYKRDLPKKGGLSFGNKEKAQHIGPYEGLKDVISTANAEALPIFCEALSKNIP